MKAITGNRIIGDNIITAVMKRRMAGKRRRAFTLVEVIVVLVILAILAAIAIPALTGYINKAEDKKYIAEARNRAVALRTVIAESYARGDFDATTRSAIYYQSGEAGPAAIDGMLYGTVKKVFQVTQIQIMLFGTGGNQWTFYREAATLTGEFYPSGNFNTANTPYWAFHLFGPNTDDVHMANAEGFYYQWYPEGLTSNPANAPGVVVTYRLDRLADRSRSAFTTAYSQAAYNPDAGYEVYYFNM